jgi:hypothetical protein
MPAAIPDNEDTAAETEIEMMKRNQQFMLVGVCIWLLAGLSGSAFAQAEVMARGNLTGIRIDGQLMEFGTALCVVQPEWSGITRTAKERQTTGYSRSGNAAIVKLQLVPLREIRERDGADWALSATETVETTGPGTARIDVEFSSAKAADIAGAFFCLDLPASCYSGSKVQLIEPAPPAAVEISLAAGEAEQNEYLRATAKGIIIIAAQRRLEVTFGEPTEVIIRDDRRQGSYDLHVFLAVLSGKAAEGQKEKKSFTLKAGGEIDRKPVAIAIEASRPGQVFDGLGGNFRLQNPKLDPPVIQYNLDNLRVAWARVEMPWRFWHPDEEVDPLEAARAGKLNPRVHEAVKYIGAVAFHSWRGCTDPILAGWRDAARALNLPLLVAEGSTDAAAWRYPQIFSEPSFVLEEISLYTRILALSQPKSILQWQLTSDYSILTGGGLFGDNDALRPTQRFWNLKQLASTPAGAFALPVVCNRPGITCAAFGKIANSAYAVHIVNTGAARPALITGLPAGVKELRAWITDTRRGMQEGTGIPVSDGKAEIAFIDNPEFIRGGRVPAEGFIAQHHPFEHPPDQTHEGPLEPQIADGHLHACRAVGQLLGCIHFAPFVCGSILQFFQTLQQLFLVCFLKAVAFLKDKGKGIALEEFSNPNGRFLVKDHYIFAYELGGKCVANAADRTMIGKVLIGIASRNAKGGAQEQIQNSGKNEIGWQYCVFTDPASNRTQKKLAYLEKADDIIIGCEISN